jgi:hypothetical protein
VSFLRGPPADTAVLVGYVRDAAHWTWIDDRGLYNVRGGTRRGALAEDTPELDASLLLLWGPGLAEPLLRLRTTPWFAVDREWMIRNRYPRARGETYLCCGHRAVAGTPHSLGALDIRSLRPPDRPTGAPFAVTWLTLLLGFAAARDRRGSTPT